MLRVLLASAAIAALPLVAAFAADSYFRTLPADDPKAWQAATAHMGSQSFAVGKQFVEVPVPAGFLDPKNILTRFRDQPEGYETIGRRSVGVFVPIDYIIRSLFHDGEVPNVNLRLWIPIDAELALLDETMFESLWDDAAAAGNPPPLPNVRNFTVLGTGKRFFSLSMNLAWQSQRSSEAVLGSLTCTENFVLVSGKLLGMKLCRELGSESDTRWVHAVTAEWINEILRRNPALAPLPGNGMGLSGVVEWSVSLSLSEPGRSPVVKIEEVFPGSPAAAAQLRPGDKIVAIGDVPLVDPDVLKGAFARLPSGDRLALTVERDNASVKPELVKP